MVGASEIGGPPPVPRLYRSTYDDNKGQGINIYGFMMKTTFQHGSNVGAITREYHY